MGGIGKAYALTKTSLSCIVVATSLLGPINTEVVLFAFALVYLRAVQHLFLFLGRILAGFRVSSSPSRKFCQYSLLVLRTIR